MPAINVARTDTFEIQRQKINQIGNQIFNISQGGSDLSTGNLKLGNGTKSLPSLSFISQDSLGLYRPESGVLGFVGDSKKIANFSVSDVIFFKDVIVQQNKLVDSGITITSSGSNYDAGDYTFVTLTGGTGEGGTANITVIEFDGSITNSGENYSSGTYSEIFLSGGSGTGAKVSFVVDGIEGDLVGGSNYIPSTYSGVSLTGGSGSGAVADIQITGDVDFVGSISNAGTNYTDSTDATVSVLNVPTQTFVVTTTTNPGNPPPDNVYQIDGNTQPTITWVQGNTYRFDISDPSVSGHPISFDDGQGQGLPTTDFIVVQKGTFGIAGSFIDVIVKPSATLGTNYNYYCTVHGGMGGSISVVSGSAGVYGHGFQALVSTSSGVVTNFDFVAGSLANGYKVGDQVSFYTPDLVQGATGTGFVFTISSITYLGSVTSVQVTDNGQDYINGDVLSATTADLGGQGAGFTFTINTDPGIVKNLVFSERGSGYVVSDVLSLSTGLTGVATTIPGSKTAVSTTLSTASPQITVASTDGIVAGMNVSGNQINIGQIAQGTTVLSVDSSTTLTLSANPTVDGTAALSFTSAILNQIVVADTSNVSVGDVIEVASGTAILDGTTTVTSILDSTTLEFSPIATQAGVVTVNIVPPYGVGTTPFAYTINSVGVVDTVSIADGGNGYADGDVLSVAASDLAQPISKTVTVSPASIINFLAGSQPASGSISVGDTVEDPNAAQSIASTVVDVTTSGPNITSITISGSSFSDGDDLIKTGVPGNVYVIDTVDLLGNRFYIDGELSPNLTLYLGDTYTFDYSDGSNTGHVFALSEFPDGSWNKVENVSTTLFTNTADITVASSTGILVGMLVTVISGDGVLLSDTFVESVNGTTVTLSKIPVTEGEAVVEFSGVEYTNGVTRSASDLSIKISDSTPSLYYYCQNHADMAGADGSEAVLTIDLNNTRVFGSGFQLTIAQVSTTNVIEADADTGRITSVEVVSENSTFTNATVVNTLTANTISGDEASLNTIISSNGLSIQTSSQSTFGGNLRIGSAITMTTSGQITSSGVIRANGSLSSNGKILISQNEIQSTSGNDIKIVPFGSHIVEVDSETALIIPVGNTDSRPGIGVAKNGSIRFNTDSNQYEGYNATSSSWSSLGGVRDIDGNTYILAELTAGANDNTLWFYNDNNNTLKLTTNFLDFRSVKKISSAKLGLPAFTLWTANTPVSIGQYIKYRNNLYEVTGAGTTATTGSEPVHISGVQNNGTAQLTWYSVSVGPIEFTEIEELRVAPNKDAPLIINSSLKLGGTTSEQWNTVSTITEDLTLEPADGKKVVIKSNTHLAIPAGNNNEKNTASAVAGSIRFNTEIQQYEGYSGTNWSSLGGVRDVDGNTYIIPETAPAANENILYFFNDNLNTLQLSKTALDFTNIDTITTSGLNNLSIDTPLVTLNLNETTIDNRDVTRTFISSSKQYLDLGLSSGLVVDPILRLDDQGDVYLNTTFGTGTFNGVKVFDGELKEFELADYALRTSSFALGKGAAESSAVDLYSSGTNKGCKVTVVSKSSSGKRSMTEYSVIDNGTDIFFSEYGSLNTSLDQYTAAFDYNATNDVRITLTLSDDHANGDIISFTVLTQVIK